MSGRYFTRRCTTVFSSSLLVNLALAASVHAGEAPELAAGKVATGATGQLPTAGKRLVPQLPKPLLLTNPLRSAGLVEQAPRAAVLTFAVPNPVDDTAEKKLETVAPHLPGSNSSGSEVPAPVVPFQPVDATPGPDGSAPVELAPVSPEQDATMLQDDAAEEAPPADTAPEADAPAEPEAPPEPEQDAQEEAPAEEAPPAEDSAAPEEAPADGVEAEGDADVGGEASVDLSAGGGVGGDASADAADAYYDPNEVETIEVTVDRRKKDIQDVSASVTAINQEQLDKTGVNSVENLASATPYVEIGQQEGNIEIYVRGVGSNVNHELGDPAVSTHIDGIYIPRPRGVGAMFFDMERVELNRGPQGTLRGRNAVGGSLNFIPNAPVYGEWQGEASAQIGNYSQRVTRSMVNIPLGDTVAFRIATFSENREPFYKNAGPIHTLTPSESADTLAYRMQLGWQATDALNIRIMHDYMQQKGTGSTGSNYAQALRSGILPEEVPEPRSVWFRGAQGREDSTHWGVSAHADYDFGPLIASYAGSYRKLDYEQLIANPDGVDYPGKEVDNLDNWSHGLWYNLSDSQVHELRLYAPDDARLRWTLGGFLYQEDFKGVLANAADQSNGFLGVEYNMPDMHMNSYAGFLDATFDITEAFRVLGGVRFTTEGKKRNGIGNVYGYWGGAFDNGDVRYGTEGMEFAGPGRDVFDVPDPCDGLRDPNCIAVFTDGVERYGIRDTVDEVLENKDYGGAWSTLTEQHGESDAKFVDFRVGAEADLSPDNLLYATFSTGHKSGGFNDNIGDIVKTYKPESLYAIEIGSKNQFSGKKTTVNASLFGYAYNDMQVQVIQQIADTMDPDSIAASSVRYNAAEARILGLDLELSQRLPAGLEAGLQAMLLDARITKGVFADTRISYDAVNQTPADLKDKFLPRSPRIAFNIQLVQNIETSFGYFDWIINAQTKGKQYMTVFNGEGKDSEGNVNPNLSDVVPWYTRFDVGVGYTRPDGLLRLDAFVNNLTDEVYMTSFINTPDLNLRFFGPPRQYAARLTLFL